MTYFAATLLILAGFTGVLLTLLTLPGIWTALVAALLIRWWQPELISWWALGAVAVIALLGEAMEFGASSVGAKKAGGSRSGAWGALLGGLVGSLVGTVAIPVPIAGTLIGAIAGAGVGAATAERGVAQRTWGESLKSGQGAAVGRALAVVGKAALAVVAALVLTASALIGGF